MNKLYVSHIAGKMQIASWQVDNCIALFEEGATIPFISRYRKERTGALDETHVAEVKHWHQLFTELEKRKEAVLASIEEQGKLTDELRAAIGQSVDPREVEDLYLPYRPKRRTRASVARERGLEPLAEAIATMQADDPLALARRFVKGEVEDAEAALAGARDILAEQSIGDVQLPTATLDKCACSADNAFQSRHSVVDLNRGRVVESQTTCCGCVSTRDDKCSFAYLPIGCSSRGCTETTGLTGF